MQCFCAQVKNQRQCGLFWAFIATGALEGQHFKATVCLVSLSEQQLLDCLWCYGKNWLQWWKDEEYTMNVRNNT